MDFNELSNNDLRDPENLKSFLKGLPDKTGVYIMKGENESTLYVGKAINLHSRVNSYFKASGDNRWFISDLPNVLVSMEIILVQSEREALLLENSLIKELKPKYNVLLQDDRSYLSIKVNLSHPYPRFESVRGTEKKDKSLYFGPYHSGKSVKYILSFLVRNFKFRTCTDTYFSRRKRPCLKYHLDRCSAPCVFKVSEKEYRAKVDKAVMFLKGETVKLLKILRKNMKIASDSLEFEEAARIRDLIFSLEKIAEPQNVVAQDLPPSDIIGYAREKNSASLVIMEMRKGRISTHRHTLVESGEFPDGDIIESFIVQHYLYRDDIPKIIVIPFMVDSKDAICRLLSEKCGHEVVIQTENSEYSKIASIAQATARNRLALLGEVDMDEKLMALARLLKMRKIPHKMECYDISHLQGKWAIGSMVVFIDGKPDKSQYRRFNIKTAKGGDDFGALREVISRRLSHKDDPGWSLPDLMVIDGGKGQLSSVKLVFDTMGVALDDETVYLISLAKERDPDGPPDRFFKPGAKNAVMLKGKGREAYILAALRDEAHRFAITGHRNKRSKKVFKSTLDKIPGIGKTIRSSLLKFFGSIEELKNASVEELTLVDGVGLKKAELIKKGLDSLDEF